MYATAWQQNKISVYKKDESYFWFMDEHVSTGMFNQPLSSFHQVCKEKM